MVQNHRLAVAALALALGIALVGCSGGTGKGAVSLKVPSGAAKTAPPSGATGGVATTSASPGGGATGGSGTGSTTPATTTSPKAGTTATTAPAHATTTAPPASKTTTPATSGPAPTPAGTYNFNLVSGSSTLTSGTNTTTLPVNSTSKLTVSNTGSGTEQWVSPSTTLNLAFVHGGVYLASELVSVVSATCTFSTPVAYPPWPLAVGAHVTGNANCGQGALALTEKVAGTASVKVGTANVATYLVQTTLALSGTDLVVAETDWYAPSLRLPVKSTVEVNGSYTSGSTSYSINSNTTYALAS